MKYSCPNVVGILATIPAKIINETPFPTPNSVISSPIHIRSIEPAMTIIRFVTNSNAVKSTIKPCDFK